MKEQLYKKMEGLFHLIEHKYSDVPPIEMSIMKLVRGNAFNMRVVGMEGIKRFRRENPDCAITFKPNHLSEADFILLSLLFRENGLKVITEGGANLFIETIDVFKDLIPQYIDPALENFAGNQSVTMADYLRARGAFKVFREPCVIKQEDGQEIKIGNKEMLSLSRAYRYHIVREKEMYVTFPGYLTMESGLFNLLKNKQIKTGRSYTGKFDGFHHLPFQMDIEASLHTNVDLYIVDVNISYEPVLEDENFMELIRLGESGVHRDEIYKKDLGYVMREFYRDKKKGELSIKFGEPMKVLKTPLKEGLKGIKIKKAARAIANSTFEKVLSMQPIFPANIYFTAFDDNFNKISIPKMKEKIDDIRDHLRALVWGKEKRPLDLYYLLDYDNHIISADEIINRTFAKFNTLDRQITARDGDMLVIYRKDVAMQYRNHTAHFFKDMVGMPPPEDKKIKGKKEKIKIS